MSSIYAILRTVHDNVHGLPMKKFNEPKIYTGGIDINNWKNLSPETQENALRKRWYIYYSFRDPKTDKLVRQPNIQLNVNRLSTKKERIEYLEILKVQLKIALLNGFNPYIDNNTLYNSRNSQTGESTTNNHQLKPVVTHGNINEIDVPNEKVPSQSKNQLLELPVVSIAEAFSKGLELKKLMMSNSSYTKYKSRIKKFENWLKIDLDVKNTPISIVRKKTVIDYLNVVLSKTSARNRNNTRTDISSLFQVLENNEIISENFVSKIDVLKSMPLRNKTYTLKQEEQLFENLEKNAPTLLLFVKFICYGFLRPKEVCRLKIKDINLEQHQMQLKAKNKPVKIKIIPEILLKELDLKGLNPESYLFARDEIGGFWNVTEDSKRDYYTKQFKKFKNEIGLGTDYGLYSFRHTFITKLYRQFNLTMTSHEVKSKLMLITGHATMSALELYLRDIDAEMPEDFSEFL